jgi:2-oxoglutarate ferredoxin oxidoreductase subunit alpha
LPTKTEQADLLQAIYGRNGECPAIVIAPATPADCFTMAIEAVRLAFKYMTPVFYLSDGYLANGAEPWAIPDIDKLPAIDVKFATEPEGFMPYAAMRKRSRVPRDSRHARTRASHRRHREAAHHRQRFYDPDNHEFMVRMRQAKVDRAAEDIPDIEIFGELTGKVLVLGWGSTYGAITSAVERLQAQGHKVSSAHIRHLNPFPKNLGDVLKGFERVIIPEMNLGQLSMMIRARFLVDAVPFSKVKGRPFQIREIVRKVEEYL